MDISDTDNYPLDHYVTVRMRYGVSTSMTRDSVIEDAEAFFGQMGLEVESKEETSISMTDGHGSITVRVNGRNQLDVEIETETFAKEAKRFIQRICL